MKRLNMKVAARSICSSHIGKFAGVLPLVAGLIFLTGCAGVSNGGSNPPPPGAGQLTVIPANTLPVGNVVVGTSGTASGSLNAATASVTVTAVTSNNSAFSVSGLSLPVTIPAGQSVPFTVTFTPSTTGSASATLTFTSDAQTPSTQETSTGTGTAASAYSVNLSWTASTSPNISGYNIYRAIFSDSSSSCGSFSEINSTLNTSTLYTDLDVTGGTSYCYATTAVNTSSEESGYSNIVSDVQIPSPQ